METSLLPRANSSTLIPTDSTLASKCSQVSQCKAIQDRPSLCKDILWATKVSQANRCLPQPRCNK